MLKNVWELGMLFHFLHLHRSRHIAAVVPGRTSMGKAHLSPRSILEGRIHSPVLMELVTNRH